MLSHTRLGCLSVQTDSMWCHISLPNGVVLEVEVEPKAQGQECLDKVCEKLGIIEVDYFGLQYGGPRGEALWLNMRNHISKQVTHRPPYKLRMRVKFLVQPHLLLQDATRSVFYLQLRQEFLDSGFKLTDRDVMVDIAAHMAQAEHGGLHQPGNHGNTGRSHDNKSQQQSCDTAESRGHSCSNTSHLLPWQHSQLSPCQQCSTPASCQNSTTLPCQQSPCQPSSMTSPCRPCALLSPSSPCPILSYAHFLPAHSRHLSARVSQRHAELGDMSTTSAKYRMLKLVSELDSYGVQYHEVQRFSGDPFHMGVGPEGIRLYNMNWTVIKSIVYPAVQMATHAGRCVYLHTLRGNGTPAVLGFRLTSKHLAAALYRCITEMHSFYRCDTVRNAVATQFSRDLKGTLASLFNEKTSLGKKYIFDIRRTCREAYDHARRKLHAAGAGTLPTNHVQGVNQGEESGCDGQSEAEPHRRCKSQECQDVQTQLEQLRDAYLCRVCMDADIAMAFFPCRHLVCCSSCAERLDICPLCRGQIHEKKEVFLPTATGLASHDRDLAMSSGDLATSTGDLATPTSNLDTIDTNLASSLSEVYLPASTHLNSLADSDDPPYDELSLIDSRINEILAVNLHL